MPPPPAAAAIDRGVGRGGNYIMAGYDRSIASASAISIARADLHACACVCVCSHDARRRRRRRGALLLLLRSTMMVHMVRLASLRGASAAAPPHAQHCNQRGKQESC